MVRSRGRDAESGKVKPGCVFMVLAFVAAIYYGIDYFTVRLKAYQMQDEVTEQATFASVIDDNTIRRRLVERATKLDIPIGPGQWQIHRVQMPDGRRVIICGEYTDSMVVRIPHKVFYFKFSPCDTTNIH